MPLCHECKNMPLDRCLHLSGGARPRPQPMLTAAHITARRLPPSALSHPWNTARVAAAPLSSTGRIGYAAIVAMRGGGCGND